MSYEISIVEIKRLPVNGTPSNDPLATQEYRTERFKMTLDEMDMGWVIKQVTAPRRKRKGKVLA